MHTEKLVLNRVLIADSPVAFDEEWNVRVAGQWMTPEEWESIRDRVDAPLMRANRLKKAVGATRSYGSHPFLIGNLRYINAARRGLIKKAPFWLRWLYEGIVTKDDLKEYG